MSYGAGHIMDMINRMKQNRALRPSLRSKFKEHHRETIYSNVNPIGKISKYQKVSKEELELVLKKIRKRAKRDQKKEQIGYAIVLICFVVLLMAMFYGLN